MDKLLKIYNLSVQRRYLRVSVAVLHPRFRNRSPFSFSALFTGFVSHHRYLPNRIVTLSPLRTLM